MKRTVVFVSVIFSKNRKCGSRFISWLTSHFSNKPKIPSHVALLIEDRWVFESTIQKGVVINSWHKWSENNELVDLIPLGEYYYDEIKTLFRDVEGRGYDYLGALYLGLFIGLNKLFKCIPIPSHNCLQSNKRYFCSEVIGKLTGNDFSMSAPIQILNKLQKDRT